ncbi:uncharacterized protein BDZ99DRAFT_482873 [Mytilinidion resinicola]|uniref:SH3 domain-containing protein n=1 Tax=Mytilinidion resinicola TaxID=574789 RepID=A0A6A6Y362_9PEZI|nr:uncharacterized protein BDZ99DRAFT_482873 [Mytilinidion resinicola]KAF2802454.1 hypothetical protein BDZ99DRAFT_482873 [Mytilinidion resinicola]
MAQNNDQARSIVHRVTVLSSDLTVYRVVLPFAATIHGELTLTEGDMILVTKKRADGWWLCVRLENLDAQGWAQKECLKAYQHLQWAGYGEWAPVPMGPKREPPPRRHSSMF